MNEIERFKKGRMIGKYLAGKPITIGGVTYTPEGNNYYYFTNHRGHRLKNTITAQEFEKIRLRTPTEETLGGYVREKNRSLFGSGYRWYDASKPNSAVAIDKEIEVGDWIIKPDGTKVHKSVRQLNTNGGQPAATQKKGRRFIDRDGSEYWLGSDGSKTLLKKGTPTASSTGSGRGTLTAVVKPKVAAKGQQYWDSQYQDFLGKMTDDLKAWLALRGIDYGSAELMLNYLMRIGKNVGKFGADNKWGKDSQAAWDELVNTTMKDNPLQKPAPEPVVDSPDLSQPGTFNTDMTFNRDNIRANRGVNYSDVDQLWDYIGSHGESTEAQLFNNVLGGLEGDAKKNAFMQMMDKYKVSGNLGRRDSGRLATMFNDLNLIGTKGTAARLSYINSFNSSFNKAQQENADARMDAARQQYAAKMAQQYTELNPVQLTAPKKFTIGSGIGASTLGDAGAGSMTELNLDDMSPREKFAMGL